jgi:F-type H+-transporting ATPase subunit b
VAAVAWASLAWAGVACLSERADAGEEAGEPAAAQGKPAAAQGEPEAVFVEAEPGKPAAGAHQGGGHVDPYDLSHANAGPKLEDPTEWRFDLALCTLAVFVLLLGLLAKVAWGPIQMGLQRREKSIADRIEEAKRSADEAAEQLRRYQEKLAAASQEVQELLTKARRDGEASADAIRRAAQETAARERDRAIEDIQAAKNLAVTEIAQRAADMAVLLAGRIVRRELSPQDHTALIAEALEKFPSQN